MTSQNDSERYAAHAIENGAYEEAVRILSPLAERNSPYALLTLGWIYETGAVGDIDLEAAISYYERANNENSPLACLYLGRLLLSNGRKQEARIAFEVGAQKDSNECKYELGKMVNSDAEQRASQLLESRDYEEAVRILSSLAERNSPYALLTLGWICETGAFGDIDLEAARSYYERAAAEGDVPAYFELGRLLVGQGEEAQARVAFETGAQREDIACMARLGRMMVEGRGGPADSDRGLIWLKNAAAQGHIHAQRTLLGIEENNAQSVIEKLFIKRKIANLVKRGAAEMLTDPRSDKVR